MAVICHSEHMINLARALQKNIEKGVAAAIDAGKLPATKKVPPVTVAPAENAAFGDYASPFALALSKIMKKPPLEIVEIVAAHMPKSEYLGKLESAAPGFLNIRISPGWMTARLDDVIQRDACEECAVHAGKSANLEFISANPTGPLTLGNARTAFSADTLANVLECAGYNVTREYYINDAGKQIRRLGESILRRALQEQGLKVEFPEDLYQGEYITEMAREIAEELKENEGKEFTEEDLQDEKVVARVSGQALMMTLAAVKKTVAEDLKISFDVWASEVAVRESGAIEDALKKLRDGGYTYVKDGAEFLATTKFGDDQDRVVVKKDKEYAYIAPDIAYHQGKFDRKFDILFTFLGADHQGHIPKLKAAMQALGNDVSKLHFVVAQWFTLSSGGKTVAMSKRKGQIFTPAQLVEAIGYDAARFFLVQHKLDAPMDLDLDLARERSDRNPVFYLQYAYVRLQSILRKAKEDGVISEVGMTFDLSSSPSLTDTTEIKLMRMMYQFPEVIDEIATHFTVHQLAYYALELARAVHVFYRHVPVLAVEDERLRLSRLQLVLAARSVMGKTLDLLGLSKPNVM